MTAEQLLLAIGEIKEETVLAADCPSKRPVAHLWVAVTAVAAAVVIGVLGYVGLLQSQQNKPPVGDPIPPTVTGTNGVSTTTPTETGKTTTSSPPTVTTAVYQLQNVSLSDTNVAARYPIDCGMEHIFAFNFEELAVENIAKAPDILPVYQVQYDQMDEDAEKAALIKTYAALVGDTLSEAPEGVFTLSDAWGERFQYWVNCQSFLDFRGTLTLELQEPLSLGDTSEWLRKAMAYCPSLFRDMQEPTLYLWNGQRHWGDPDGDGRAAATEVFFSANIYDAANDPDGTAKWMSGVRLHVENGVLKSFTVPITDILKTEGYYPVFAIEEAIALVKDECERLKAYDRGYVEEDYEILSVELVYNSNSMSHWRAPHYRFLVTAKDYNRDSALREQTGMTSYCEIMFCAVPPEYWMPDTDDLLVTQR